MEWEKYASKGEKLITQEMDPNEVQLSGTVEGLVREKTLKLHEFGEEDIDVEKVDNGDLVDDELNENGFHLTENGHSGQFSKEKDELFPEEKGVCEANSAALPDVKSVLRLKSSRRNSTSSRSSSVSSVPSVKPQTPSAMQMEVSMDDAEKDHMEPLIMEGTAEDLEVSIYGSHCDADNEGNSVVTTDSEAVKAPSDVGEYLDDVASEDSWEQIYVHEVAEKKAKVAKSNKVIKPQKSPQKPKPVVKAAPRTKATPRTKSLKLKGAKQSAKTSESIAEKLSNDSDNSLSKDGSVTEDVNIKSSRSPPKRPKSTPSKHDHEEEAEDKSDAEHVPRRSSRPRQTPQKYNSSLYVESNWDFSGAADDRLNNSDAAFGGTNIRSVRGRRSLRKSRNISTLNASLHDESSPWDNDFKVLTPCGDGLSIHNVAVGDNVDSSTPLKRKASGDDEDYDEDENKRGQKKMCVEADIETSASSSFFSVITSPIMLLKNKLRGSSVSSSTPIRIDERKDNDAASEMESMLSASENDAGENVAGPIPVVEPAIEAVQESRNWCTIM